MTIPPDQLNKWKSLRSRGDGVKFLEANPKYNNANISRAFTSGKCSDDLFAALSLFYRQKDERVKEMAI